MWDMWDLRMAFRVYLVAGVVIGVVLSVLGYFALGYLLRHVAWIW